MITRPAGHVRRAGREYIFKLAKTADTLPDLGGIAVGRAGAVPVRLGDVADIVQASGEIRSIARVNGQPTVMLTVMKENGANALRVAREVRRRLAEIRKGLPESLDFRTVDDESAVIGRNLRHLGLLAGFIVVLIFLMIFAAIRRLLPSLLILSSVAFSVLITFNLLYLLRIPLNMLTLGALALGFGMFVDNSIVVFENALRLREQGLAPDRAALQGAREVFVAVLASTLTTVGVFACFPFFQGRLRSYYLPLALVMTSALMASLAVSFSLIPALAPRLLRKVKPTTSRSSDRRLFARTVGGLLRHPALTVLAAGALLFFSHRWFRAEVPIGDFFNWLPQERLTVSLSLPHGSDIETLDAIVRRFEDIVLSTDHDKEMTADIGTDSAYLNISFPPEVEHSARPYVLKDRLIRLATEFAGVSMYVYGFSQEGYYSSAETSTYFESGITFHGYDLRRLKGITDGIAEGLLRNPRIREVRAVSNRYGWWGEDTFEVVLRPDREALRRYDVHPGWLRAQVLSLIGGRFGSAHRGVLGGRESDIVVTLPAAERTDLRRLQNAIFRTGSGAALRLGDVLKAEERPVTGFIEREDRRFVRQLMWEFRGPAKAAERFKKAVFAGLDLPPGFSADLDEERFLMTREEKGQVTLALLIALAVIFMILAALYESFVQPFIVMMAVPLALVGVFAAFVVAGARFDSAAYIGVLLMAGIVVNNAILLVDHINLKRREGMELVAAIVQGTRERVRPILMTTATTVFGMLPMLLFHAEAGKSDIWSSLALCTAGGLTASTPLILTVIPVLYLVAERLRPRLARSRPRSARELEGRMKPVLKKALAAGLIVAAVGAGLWFLVLRRPAAREEAAPPPEASARGRGREGDRPPGQGRSRRPRRSRHSAHGPGRGLRQKKGRHQGRSGRRHHGASGRRGQEPSGRAEVSGRHRRPKLRSEARRRGGGAIEGPVGDARGKQVRGSRQAQGYRARGKDQGIGLGPRSLRVRLCGGQGQEGRIRQGPQVP